MAEKIKKVPVSFSLTEEQAAFLKTLPNRSEIIQKFVQELMMTHGLTDQQKIDMKVANEVANAFVQKFLENWGSEEQEPIYINIMVSELITVRLLKEGRFNRSGLDVSGLDKVQSEEGIKFLERSLGHSLTPEDLETIQVIENEVRRRLTQEYQKRWSKTLPPDWDKREW